MFRKHCIFQCVSLLISYLQILFLILKLSVKPLFIMIFIPVHLMMPSTAEREIWERHGRSARESDFNSGPADCRWTQRLLPATSPFTHQGMHILFFSVHTYGGIVNWQNMRATNSCRLCQEMKNLSVLNMESDSWYDQEESEVLKFCQVAKPKY